MYVSFFIIIYNQRASDTHTHTHTPATCVVRGLQVILLQVWWWCGGLWLGEAGRKAKSKLFPSFRWECGWRVVRSKKSRPSGRERGRKINGRSPGEIGEIPQKTSKYVFLNQNDE